MDYLYSVETKPILSILFLTCCSINIFGQGVWTQKADFGGKARCGAIGFSIGTKGYIGTGLDSINFYSDFWEWDQVTNTWTQKASFPGIPRGIATGFSIGTKGYIGTGSDSLNNNHNDFWEWDQATNTWTQKATLLGVSRFASVGFSILTKGYIGTGQTDNGFF